MSGVGTNGGYGAPANIDGTTSTPYPPGPSMWTAGQWFPLRYPGYLFAQDLNQQLSSAVAFLSRKPMFQLSQFTAQAIGSGVDSALTLDTEISDAWGMHADDTDSSQVVIQPGMDGIWLVQGSVPYNTSATGHYFSAQIIHTPADGSGEVIISGERFTAAGAHLTPRVADLVTVSAGDVLQLGALQTSGATIDTWCSVSSSDIARYAGQSSPVLTGRWAGSGASCPGGVLTVLVPAAWDGDTPVMVQAALQLAAPSLTDFADDGEVTSSALNASITSPVLFTSNVPACRAQANGTPAAIAPGAYAQVTGLQSTFDNWGAWSNSTNTWTCPADGCYLAYAQCAWSQQPASFLTDTRLNCVVSGSSVTYAGTSASGTTPAGSVFRHLRFSAGDTVQVQADHDAATSIAPAGATNTRFFALWVSA